MQVCTVNNQQVYRRFTEHNKEIVTLLLSAIIPCVCSSVLMVQNAVAQQVMMVLPLTNTDGVLSWNNSNYYHELVNEYQFLDQFSTIIN